MTTNLINTFFSQNSEESLFSRLKNFLIQQDDSSIFDELLSNKSDALLFDKTINDLKHSNKKSETITLSSGKKITVSLK